MRPRPERPGWSWSICDCSRLTSACSATIAAVAASRASHRGIIGGLGALQLAGNIVEFFGRRPSLLVEGAGPAELLFLEGPLADACTISASAIAFSASFDQRLGL